MKCGHGVELAKAKCEFATPLMDYVSSNTQQTRVLYRTNHIWEGLSNLPSFTFLIYEIIHSSNMKYYLSY